MAIYIIAHDLGTSGDKATLFTMDGKLLDSQVRSYDVNFWGGCCAEQNPRDWWSAVCESTKALLKNINKDEIAAVSFSAQMQGCLVVDEKGEPLREAIIWADHQAEAEATSIGAAVVAGVGVGIFDSFDEVKKFLKFEEQVTPNKEIQKLYQEKKKIFNHIYLALCPVYKELR